MGIKKIIKEIERHSEKQYDRGYEDGIADEPNQLEYWGEGVMQERNRIIALFKMLSDNELEHGSGTRAKFWKEAADIVKVADELEVYNEEGEYLG